MFAPTAKTLPTMSHSMAMRNGPRRAVAPNAAKLMTSRPTKGGEGSEGAPHGARLPSLDVSDVSDVGDVGAGLGGEREPGALEVIFGETGWLGVLSGR